MDLGTPYLIIDKPGPKRKTSKVSPEFPEFHHQVFPKLF